VVGALARAHVRRQAEAAPLRQLLELVLVHPYCWAGVLLPPLLPSCIVPVVSYM
jgi:hypothetical protein